MSATKFEFRLSKMTPLETFSLERLRSLSKNAHFGMWLNRHVAESACGSIYDMEVGKAGCQRERARNGACASI